MRKDRWKRLADEFITKQTVKILIEYSARILIKMIDNDFFKFLKLYDIKFESKEEEREFKEYFKKEYMKKIGGR